MYVFLFRLSIIKQLFPCPLMLFAYFYYKIKFHNVNTFLENIKKYSSHKIFFPPKAAIMK